MQTLSCLQLMDSPHEIESLLRAEIGSHIRLVDCRVAKRHQDYCVILAQLSHPSMEVVVKLAGPAAIMAGQFDRTTAIHQLVAKSTTIPVPDIIALDITCHQWPWRYLIRTSLPGVEWATLGGRLNETELISAYQQIGKAVGQLHSIAFPAFGEIDAQGHVGLPDTSCLSALRRRTIKLVKSTRLQKIFLTALEQRANWFESVQDSRLCHEDLHGYNILFNQVSGVWRLAAIIDFDKAWAGHPETDLARLEVWRGMTSPDFWVAYQRYWALDSDYVYRRPIYQLLWCLEYASSSVEHLMDTQQVCRELGLPKIESFRDDYSPDLGSL